MLRNYIVLIILLLLVYLPGGAHTAPPEVLQQLALRPAPLDAPKKGAFLVASRNMSDPRFRHSVILLLEHTEEGTLGLIVNRPTDFSLSEALPELEKIDKAEHLLFFGGPVAMNTLLFLIRNESNTEHMELVLDKIYWSASRYVLEQLLKRGKPATDMRLYFGRAGWAPGQLDAELARGSWRLFQADAEAVFRQDLDTLWEDLMKQPEIEWIMVWRHIFSESLPKT